MVTDQHLTIVTPGEAMARRGEILAQFCLTHDQLESLYLDYDLTLEEYILADEYDTLGYLLGGTVFAHCRSCKEGLNDCPTHP